MVYPFYMELFWTGNISPAWLLVIYAALGLWFAPFSRKLKLAALSALTALVWATLTLGRYLAGLSPAGAFRVDFIDVGQGSSAHVRLPSGEKMLVDGGGVPDGSYDVGRAVLSLVIETPQGILLAPMRLIFL
jgi:competence protein ComEC